MPVCGRGSLACHALALPWPGPDNLREFAFSYDRNPGAARVRSRVRPGFRVAAEIREIR